MSYPDELLPKSNYKEIDFNQLSPKFHYTIRRSAKPLPNDEEEITYDFICEQSSDLFGLSLNLLGVFRPFHIEYKPRNDTGIRYHDRWNKEMGEVLKPEQVLLVPKDTYGETKPLVPIFLRVGLLLNRKFPYGPEINNVTQQFTGTITLEHWPTLSNFWHCQVKVVDINGEEIKRSSKLTKGFHKRAAGFMLKNLLEEMVLDEPETEPIPEALYKTFPQAPSKEPNVTVSRFVKATAFVATSYLIIKGVQYISRGISRLLGKKFHH